MSYALGVAGDARADLAAMDPWLQEEFWDELDRLAADPSLLSAASARDDILYKFTRDTAGLRHTVTMTLSCNDSARKLTVLGITYRRRMRRG